MTLDISQHPCFNDSARGRFGRIHLPVAPHCNVQCNFCRRDFDCANESRPGVTSTILSPGQALFYLERVLEKDPRISVVGIAGPGDPFANESETMETLRLVRKRFPEMILCVASNGLNVAPYVDELASLNVSHVTLTINAVDPAIGAKIYAWIRDGKSVYHGLIGAKLLWNRQSQVIPALKEQGIAIKINTIVVPGVNDHHVVEIARKVAELGADISNCVPLYPVAGTSFASIASPSHEQIAAIRTEVSKLLPIMEHCTRCRADAVGLLGAPVSLEAAACLRQSAAMPMNPFDERPYVAAATSEGVLVNQHLGEAKELSIFQLEGYKIRLLETRLTPPPGGGKQRWLALAGIIKDCRAVLTASAGEAPRSVLASNGIKVVMMEGLIEEGVIAVLNGEEIRAPLRKKHHCGAGCSGNGMGCM
jgi:nitrogen fixation protein NifB